MAAVIFKCNYSQVGGAHEGLSDDTPLVEGTRRLGPGELAEGSIRVEVTFTVLQDGGVSMSWSLDTSAALPAPLQPGLLACAAWEQGAAPVTRVNTCYCCLLLLHY